MLKKTFALLCLALPLSAGAHVELCDLEGGSTLNRTFEYKRIFDIKKDAAISAFHLSLVNKYFARDGYGPRTLEQIQGLFKTHETNDLFIISYSSKNTGHLYLEVVTFPGENPVGTLYDGNSGEVLGHNYDGTVSIVTKAGEIACYEINP